MIQSKQIQRVHRILVVDDQEINRDALGVILEDQYEVEYTENGKEALEMIRNSGYDFSLVMLDLIMPVMNGFEVLEAMRGDERMKNIPVIVLTAEKSAELEALKLGAADFITKPFDMHEVILARVGRMIELSEGKNLISAAEHDRISLLYSRNFFFEYANRLFTYHPDLHLDAAVLNIEHFHSINDLNGREFGNKVLRALGDAIRAFLSETDGIACRYEADNFNIYFTHRADYSELLDRFQTKMNGFSKNVDIHLRMGVMPWQKDMDPLTMFDRARTACNMVRGDFKRPLMIYDDEMHKRDLFNQRLINDLRAAVDDRQLTVYFQPKYNIQCDPPVLSSAEALIRWKHPDLGMISPGSFIPLFEEKGLISIVDEFVWHEAAGKIAEWRGKYGVTVPVSVNLSRADVFDVSLVDTMKKLTEENGLGSKDLKLEVTESAYSDNAKQQLEVIASLRENGFEIEMDDFGSGYSSLNTLSAMPVDVLKIDMKFIRNIETSETDLQLVRLVLDLSRYLKVKVVAEGVETEGQLKLLKDAGCDIVQGYYFSRPLPADEFEKLIEREKNDERIQ
ncbi:MAG: EAL domain-containing protein [Clostridia bacterium]|nr:EAL domain-containing protein [Clostridia bacterium]